MSGRKAVFMAEEAKTKAKKAAPKKTAAKKVTKTATESVKKTEPRAEVAAETVAVATEVAQEVVAEAVKKSAPTSHNSHPTSSNYSPEFDLKEMLETGAHFGHQARRWHPKMAPYIYAKKGGVHIFDLIITAEKLKEACTFAYQLGKENKTLIFVGTKRQAKDIVKKEAVDAGAMYIINRWLGGFISNWEQVSKSIKEMNSIRKGLAEGGFKNYTKKERTLLDKKAQRLERFFGGVSELRKLPDALFIIDAGREDTAILEATAAGIPLIGMVDTNDNPEHIDYVIPANDDAVRSLEYMIHAVAEAYKAGRAARK